jgi:hypothetical protein
VELVDRLVAEQHLLEQGRIAYDEALDGGSHALLGQSTHLEQAALQRFELLPEMRYLPFH